MRAKPIRKYNKRTAPAVPDPERHEPEPPPKSKIIKSLSSSIIIIINNLTIGFLLNYLIIERSTIVLSKQQAHELEERTRAGSLSAPPIIISNEAAP